MCLCMCVALSCNDNYLNILDKEMNFFNNVQSFHSQTIAHISTDSKRNVFTVMTFADPSF